VQKINLKNHIKYYHEEKRCNSRCLQKGHLKVHFESVHEGKKELIIVSDSKDDLEHHSLVIHE
jgi:hypothetical protein